VTAKAKIKKVLVVLSPDLIRPDRPAKSTLLQRAVSVARITGCELELFHVCYDSKLEDGLFQSQEELARERKRLTDRQATRVAELAARLRRESVKVSHETRWDHPRPDAIIRKIGRSSPDLVLKQSREHSYKVGLASNVDWELARRSPAHVWLVNNDVEDIDRIVAAVGTRSAREPEILTPADYDLMRTTRLVGDIFKAAIYPVNAYQLPSSHEVFAGMLGAVAVTEHQKLREEIAKTHGGVVRAFANYFETPADNVRIAEGQPDKIISEVAEQEHADLIAISARSIGRFERLVGQVTVEPVMSQSDCDVLVVREEELVRVPEAKTRPLKGTPQFSLEHALTDPEDTFDSPQQISNQSDLSIDLRQRILQAWEYDIRAEMADQNEGGTVREVDANALDAIASARETLRMKKTRAKGRPPTLEEMST
jgi:nucleotide-binding universal stress UspA family protein